jgi:hypothetical protein
VFGGLGAFGSETASTTWMSGASEWMKLGTGSYL